MTPRSGNVWVSQAFSECIRNGLYAAMFFCDSGLEIGFTRYFQRRNCCRGKHR